jgi:hypothetical protein
VTAETTTAGADPRPTVDASGAHLVGQQLAVYRALAEQSGELAGWYLGACAVLMVPANPERLVQAGHSIRELMNNLHTISLGRRRPSSPRPREAGEPDESEAGATAGSSDTIRS